MKKLSQLFVSSVAVSMLTCAPAFADASQNGCEHSGGKAAGCSATVPEPGTGVLLTAGVLLVAGAVALFSRKRLPQN